MAPNPYIDWPHVRDVSVEALIEIWNPLDPWVWENAPEGEYDPTDYAPVLTPVSPEASTAEHLGRIHGLMQIGWDDPICIEGPTFGIMPAEVVADGNHRLATAILLGHSKILAELYGGEDEHANDLFKPDRPW